MFHSAQGITGFLSGTDFSCHSVLERGERWPLTITSITSIVRWLFPEEDYDACFSLTCGLVLLHLVICVPRTIKPTVSKKSPRLNCLLSPSCPGALCGDRFSPSYLLKVMLNFTAAMGPDTALMHLQSRKETNLCC